MHYLGKHGQSVSFHFLMADLKAAKDSKFLISFSTSFNVFGGKGVKDLASCSTVLGHLEKNLLLFRVSYTELWFNGKTSFMRIGER